MVTDQAQRRREAVAILEGLRRRQGDILALLDVKPYIYICLDQFSIQPLYFLSWLKLFTVQALGN